MSNDFWQSDTYKIIEAMKATGNRPGIILLWSQKVYWWARDNPTTPDAQAVLSWFPLWQVRPFYTAEELAPLFPVLAVALGIAQAPTPQRTPQRLAFELDYGGLPSRMFQGQRYFIVERIHHWSKVSQKEFEDAFS